MGVRVKTTTREGEHAEQVTEVQKHRGWLRVAALYLPTPSPRGAPLSLTAWRAGRSTAGQTGRSASSLHCREEKKKKKNKWFHPVTKNPFSAKAWKAMRELNGCSPDSELLWEAADYSQRLCDSLHKHNNIMEGNKRLRNILSFQFFFPFCETYPNTEEAICIRSQLYPLEQLGVEKRSMAGAVLIVPPVVEIGDVSVVEKEGLLESSLSLCSWGEKFSVNPRATDTQASPSDPHASTTVLWNRKATFRALSRACSSSRAACFSRSSTLVKDIPVLASDDTAFDKVLALQGTDKLTPDWSALIYFITFSQLHLLHVLVSSCFTSCTGTVNPFKLHYGGGKKEI